MLVCMYVENSCLCRKKNVLISRVCKSAYSEQVPWPGIMEGCGRKGIQCKHTLVCMAGLTRCRLCGCCRPASGETVTGVSERSPAINQGSHRIQNYVNLKEVCVLVLGFFAFISAVNGKLAMVNWATENWATGKFGNNFLVGSVKSAMVKLAMVNWATVIRVTKNWALRIALVRCC